MKNLTLFFLLLFAGSTVKADFFGDPLGTERYVPHAEACGINVDFSKPLTLIDVVSQALCHNPQTRQQWANARAQAAALGSSRSQYLPSVAGSASYQHSKSTIYGVKGLDSSNTVITTGNLSQASTVFSPVASLSLLLYDFGGREANVEVTKHNLEAANFTYNSVLQQVIFNAMQAYYQYFSATEEVKAALESEKSSNASFEAATLRYHIGAAAVADKLQAQTAYSQAKLARLQAENNARIKKGALANIMALGPDSEFSLVENHTNKTDSGFDSNVKAMIAEAKKLRPDIAASQAQLRSSKANVELARAADLPRISLNGSEGYNKFISGGSNNSSNYGIGLSLSVPLFTGFDNRYRIKAAERQLEAQEAATAQVENDSALDVWRTYQNFETAKQALVTTAFLIDSAVESEKVALGRYKAGSGSIIDVLNAQTQLASARQQRIESQYNWFITKADLVRAMGRLNTTTLKE